MGWNLKNLAGSEVERRQLRGWLAELDGRIVGGAGLWLMEFPPGWMDEKPLRAYLLNFWPRNTAARSTGSMGSQLPTR
jgi:hypothetical protein